jgi:CoA:oxalate CoA-transferase
MAPWNSYETADSRHLIIVAHNEKYWRNLIAAVSRSEWGSDERFSTNAARMRHREELDRLLAAIFRTDTLANWTQRLTEGDVLFSPVRDFEGVFSDPEVRETLVESVDHPSAGPVELLRTPIRMAANPVSIRRAPPRLGEHTHEVLAESYPHANASRQAAEPARQRIQGEALT